MLENLIRSSRVRDVNPTTKRLVERCLAGEWCVSLKAKQTQARKDSVGADDDKGSDSSWGGADTGVGAGGHGFTINKINATRSHLGLGVSSSSTVNVSSIPISNSNNDPNPNAPRPRSLKPSKSMEFKKNRGSVSGSGPGDTNSDMLGQQLPRSPRSPLFENVRRGSTASNASYNSSMSLHGVASAALPGQHPPPPIKVVSPTSIAFSHSPASPHSPSAAPSRSTIHAPRRQGTANSAHIEGAFADRTGDRDRHPRTQTQPHDYRDRLGEALDSTLVLSSLSISSSSQLSSPQQQQQPQQQTRRSAPPPPTQTKRRKPPAIPVGNGRSPTGNGNGNGNGMTFTAIKSSTGLNSGGVGGVSSPLGWWRWYWLVIDVAFERTILFLFV